MSDLVVRLRRVFGGGLGLQAADRIEALEAELHATDVARVEALDEVARLQARERELEAALSEIRDQEWTENVLDPQWAARIAQAALAAVSAETEDDNGK